VSAAKLTAVGAVALPAVGAVALAAAGSAAQAAAANPAANPVAHLKDVPVVEFRRYTIKDGERQHFADYFETFFPEAFEQLGAIAFGQFLERDHPARFTWIRGFHSLGDRAAVNGAFYDGPLWKEHRTKREGARGIVVAQIFAVKAGEVDAFAARAGNTLAGCRAAGAREAGLLATLDVPNNFPRLPIRTDGPWVVWLGIVENEEALRAVRTAADRSARKLSESGLLRGEPEFVVLQPTRRSRLRWLP